MNRLSLFLTVFLGFSGVFQVRTMGSAPVACFAYEHAKYTELYHKLMEMFAADKDQATMTPYLKLFLKKTKYVFDMLAKDQILHSEQKNIFFSRAFSFYTQVMKFVQDHETFSAHVSSIKQSIECCSEWCATEYCVDMPCPLTEDTDSSELFLRGISSNNISANTSVDEIVPEGLVSSPSINDREDMINKIKAFLFGQKIINAFIKPVEQEPSLVTRFIVQEQTTEQLLTGSVVREQSAEQLSSVATIVARATDKTRVMVAYVAPYCTARNGAYVTAATLAAVLALYARNKFVPKPDPIAYSCLVPSGLQPAIRSIIKALRFIAPDCSPRR